MERKKTFKRLAVLCLTLIVGVAMTGIFMPADSSAATTSSAQTAAATQSSAQTSAKSWKSYTGTYTKYFVKGQDFPVYGVLVKGGSGKIKMQVLYYGNNGSPIYCTYVKTVKMSSKGKGTFKWKDSWTNSGSGTIYLKDKKVKIIMKQTHTAKDNRYSLATKKRTLTRHTKKVDFLDKDEM